MKKKKILFLLPDFSIGGAENVFVKLANFFGMKYEIYFMVLEAKGPNLKKIDQKIKIIELKKKSSIRSIFKINNYIKEKKIDIAIGTLAMAYALSLSKLLGRSDCKYIVRIGNMISPEINNLGFFKKQIMIFYQKVLNFSDIIITQSESMKKDLSKYVKKKSIVIYNPILIKDILRLSKVKNSKINLDKKCFNIISVGRLAFQKDYKTSLLAISKLKLKINNIKYYIVGSGHLKKELMKYSVFLGIKDCVVFVGQLKNPYNLMKDANVILLTSLYEGFSNVILESLTLNTPVVATKSPGGNNEVISNGKNGFFVEVQNSDDVVQKLILIKNDKKKIKNNMSKFDIKIIGKKYEKLFQSTL
jgi:glycosyltransferase involved in cell wall biosynthesis